jgi:hypothetical protein
VSWTIKLPHRGDLSVPLSDCAFAARALQQDDALVTRQIVVDWATSGVRTVGQALDRLEAMPSTERRELLDRTRVEVGLPSTEDVERQQRANAPLTLRPAPLTATTELRRREDGTFFEVPVDPPRWGIGDSGQPVLLNAAETDAARQRAAEVSLNAQRRAQTGERGPDAAAHAEYQRAMRDQLQHELPEHMRGAA